MLPNDPNDLDDPDGPTTLIRARDRSGEGPILTLDLTAPRHEPDPTRSLDILRRVDYGVPEYAAAIASWPDVVPIWPLLPAGAARLHFARHCLARGGARGAGSVASDQSDESGAAASRCARSSSRVNLDPTARQNLRDHYRVGDAEAPPKLRVPLLMVTSPAHVFNAIHLGGPPRAIASYLFVDALEDELIVPLSDHWHRYVACAWIMLSDLVDCSPQGRLLTRYVQGFERTSAGRMRSMSRERASELRPTGKRCG